MFNTFTLENRLAATAGLKGHAALADQLRQGASSMFGHMGSAFTAIVLAFDMSAGSIVSSR